jgi:hypothetical protein
MARARRLATVRYAYAVPPVAFILLLACGGCARNICVTGDLTRRQPEYEAIATLPEMAWTKHARVCRVGNYLVTVPADDAKKDAIWVTRDAQPLLVVIPGLGASLYQPARREAKPQLVLTVSDRNDDGIYDQLIYTTFDAAGRPVADIFDLNLDGEPDFKFVRDGNHSFARVNGEWIPLEKGKVMVGGIWKRVKWEEQRWVIPE